MKSKNKRVRWFSFKTNGVTIDVDLAHPKVVGDNAVGWYKPDKCLICISWAMPAEFAEGVVLHEMAHAALYCSGANKLFKKGREERHINAISATLFGALKDSGMFTLPPRPETPYDKRDAS